MAESVTFRGSRADAKSIIRSVTATLGGSGTDHQDLIAGVYDSVGFAALSDIADDFLTKSRGGTGVDGTKWDKLAPATLAYGRKAPKGRGFAPGGKDGLLTKAQLQQWRKIYGGRLQRFATSMPLKEAKSFAAAIAWNEIKKRGGKTKIAEYANRPHEIGRDTGIMFNSLSPGTLSGGTYEKPATEGGDEQKFSPIEGGIIVGTNVKYAAAFDKKRKIMPSEAPQDWVDGWKEVAARALSVAFRLALFRGI